MKGETFVGMLKNHAEVINNHAARLDKTAQALAYLSTRRLAEEQARAGRFALVWIPLREMFRPGSFMKAVEALQQALLNPQAPAKVEVKPITPAPAQGAQEATK
jgi:hypothetical protein